MDITNPGHDVLLAKLDQLSRKYLLNFRIEVGRTVAQELYGGDLAVMRERLGHRDGTLREFATARAQELEDRGLSEQMLRHCLNAWGVVTELPTLVADQLLFGHVVALSRVDDRQTREHLAIAAVENEWDGRRLINAIQAVARGEWIDGAPDVPGLQPPPPPEPPAPAPAEETKAPSTGRLVQRFEKTARDVADVVGDFERVQVEAMSAVQRERAREALGLVIERVLALRDRLA